MIKLNPYLRYNDGKCREAFTFYQKIFGGKLTFQPIGETPMAKEISADKQHLIMHAELNNDGIQLFGSDMMRDVATVGDNFSLSLNYDNEKDMRKHFEQLSEGGNVFMPIEDVPWGAIFGMVTDKYGFEWMLNYQKGAKK